MKPRNRRFVLLIVGGVMIMGGLVIVGNVFKDNLVFFYSPSELRAESISVGDKIRVGGLVLPGSIKRDSESTAVEFAVTDGSQTVIVRFAGILPDLFREGKGIVAEGKLINSELLEASQVLAKHDENYMPPEVAEALSRSESVKEGVTDTSRFTNKKSQVGREGNK